MPEVRVETTWKATRPKSTGGESEAKVDPVWQAEQNKKNLERYMAARRARGVVDPTGRDDSRKKHLRDK